MLRSLLLIVLLLSAALMRSEAIAALRNKATPAQQAWCGTSC